MASNAMTKVKNKLSDEARYGKLVHGGYLNKRSKGKSWTKRYAVLWEDMALRFYDGEARGTVLGKIKLKHVSDIAKLDRQQALELNPESPYFFSIMSTSLKKTWQFGCDEESRATEWVHILQSALTINKRRKTKSKKPSHGLPPQPAAEDGSTLRSRMDSVQSSAVTVSGQSLSAAGILHIDESFSRRRSKPVLGRSIDEDHAVDDQQDDIEERLIEENTNIVFEGNLDRKTNQKVLGRSLWEQRHFKLSTHSLSVYLNEQTNIAESVVMISSVIAVNRSTKSDGTDLKDNRFDISTRDGVLNLRTANPIVCRQWIHFLSLELKNHQKSIRTGLESLAQTEWAAAAHSNGVGGGRRSAAVSGPPPHSADSAGHDKGSLTKKVVKRFKRNSTTRPPRKVDLIDPDEAEEIEAANAGDPEVFDEEKRNEVGPEGDDGGGGGDSEENHDGAKKGRRLSIKSWAAQLVAQNGASDGGSPYDEAKGSLLRPMSFEGFLVRRIGAGSSRIGEKLYFRLSHDTLEFSKVDATLDGKEDLLRVHSANILGSISVEHIKSVRMAPGGDDEDSFVVVHNERDSNTDWILTTERRDRGRAREWVEVLQRAQREAKDIVSAIKGIHSDDEEGDDDDDSDSEDGAAPNTKSKRLGGLKALQKMINDETIEELETARNHELKNTKGLDNGFEIRSLRNEESLDDVQPQRPRTCSCLCFR